MCGGGGFCASLISAHSSTSPVICTTSRDPVRSSAYIPQSSISGGPVAEMRKSNKKPEGYKVTVWEMLRDVLVASMNKGQFPLAIVGLIIITIIWRMPSESVGKLAFEVVEEMKNGYLIGYVVAFVAIIGWFFHAKAQRRW